MGQKIGFEYTYRNFDINSAIEAIKTKDGNVLLSVNGSEGNRLVGHVLLKLNGKGLLMDSVHILKDTSNIYRIINLNKGYATLGQFIKNKKHYFNVATYDESLNLLKESTKEIPSVLQALEADIDKDSNIIVGGGITESNFFFPRLFGAKLNAQGDILDTKYRYEDTLIGGRNKVDPYVGWFDCMKVVRDSSQYLFHNGNYMVLTDSNFKALETIQMPFWKDCPCSVEDFSYISYRIQPTMLRINDSIFYIGGRANIGKDNGLYLLKMSLKKGRIAIKALSIPSKEVFMAFNHCIDTTSNGMIYLGGAVSNSFNLNVTYPFVEDTSQFILHKIDRNFNTLWTKRYGKPASHVMYGVLATDDGGCLIYGHRFDFLNDKKVEAYIIKVDENGTMTNETSIPLSIPTIQLYPNPGSGKVQITSTLPAQTAIFNFYNANGNQVKTISTNETQPSLDLSNLPSGIYFFSVFADKRLISTGKWFKL
jgi:Secretion system C-terminal sorting domain